MDEIDEFETYLKKGEALINMHRPSVTKLMENYNSLSQNCKISSPRPTVELSMTKTNSASPHKAEFVLTEVSDKESEESYDNEQSESDESSDSGIKEFNSEKFIQKLTTLQRYEIDDCEPFEW